MIMQPATMLTVSEQRKRWGRCDADISTTIAPDGGPPFGIGGVVAHLDVGLRFTGRPDAIERAHDWLVG